MSNVDAVVQRLEEIRRRLESLKAVREEIEARVANAQELGVTVTQLGAGAVAGGFLLDSVAGSKSSDSRALKAAGLAAVAVGIGVTVYQHFSKRKERDEAKQKVLSIPADIEVVALPILEDVAALRETEGLSNAAWQRIVREAEILNQGGCKRLMATGRALTQRIDVAARIEGYWLFLSNWAQVATDAGVIAGSTDDPDEVVKCLGALRDSSECILAGAGSTLEMAMNPQYWSTPLQPRRLFHAAIAGWIRDVHDHLDAKQLSHARRRMSSAVDALPASEQREVFDSIDTLSGSGLTEVYGGFRLWRYGIAYCFAEGLRLVIWFGALVWTLYFFREAASEIMAR